MRGQQFSLLNDGLGARDPIEPREGVIAQSRETDNELARTSAVCATWEGNRAGFELNRGSRIEYDFRFL
jgi:hypothetical protein